MKAARRLALLAVPALLALASCDIPTTGVVEAGEPASGIRPVTPVYFVRDGTLVAVPRTTAWPGDAGEAVRLLLRGPTPGEAGKRLTTAIRGRRSVPASPTSAPSEPPTDAPTDLQWQTPTDEPTADVRGDRLTLRLPLGTGPLTRMATRQVICTAAAAHRVTAPSAAPVTVEVTDGSGWHAGGSDEGCPALPVD
ncbi:hypothetical protein [Streptomyces justiciae]|uniref:hypothetical protein n=1 Tax=Streptomyces justiciae TaxID=2780140 RepID=UPI001880FF2C|nr:hypothetical protein [Streptomyces justiciae]MBE8470632.1 hypothetical protein [Streptomyces justiciae]